MGEPQQNLPELDSADTDPTIADRQIITKLEYMGFSYDLIMAGLTHSNSRDLETLINFMVKGEDGWNHEFISNDDIKCKICQDIAQNHSSFKYSLDLNAQIPLESASIKRPVSISLPQTASQTDPANLCEICLSDLTDKYTSPLCTHSFCKSCITKYLEVLIKDSKVDKIKCPISPCFRQFEENEIRSLTSDELFEKYLKFKKRKLLMSDPSIKFCCEVDCEGFIKYLFDDKTTCSVCFKELCFKCGLLWHEGKTCNEFIDSKYRALEKEQVVNCPSCYFEIEKMPGCDYMRCTNCGYEWYFNSGGTNTNAQNGMQDTRESRLRIKLKKYCLGLFSVILIIIFSPLIIPLGPALFIGYFFREDEDNDCYWEAGRVKVVITYIGSVLLSPLIYVIAIISGLVYLITLPCVAYRRRRRLERLYGRSPLLGL